MENEVVRRLAVSSSAWLGGGRCTQEKRGAKASEEKGRRCMPSIEPKLPAEREEKHAARCAKGSRSGAAESNPRLRGPTEARTPKARRS